MAAMITIDPSELNDLSSPLDLLLSRRSGKPRDMVAPGPNAEELETIFTIATRVPDHGKLAPWRFVLFEGEARLAAGRRLAEIFAASNPGADADRLDIERKRLALAPLVIAVVSRAAPHVKKPEWEQELSAGAVCQNLVVAAHAMGYAASWLTQWYAYDRQACEAFGLAAHEKIAGFIHIGRSNGIPEDRARPSLASIVSRFEG